MATKTRPILWPDFSLANLQGLEKPENLELAGLLSVAAAWVDSEQAGEQPRRELLAEAHAALVEMQQGD